MLGHRREANGLNAVLRSRSCDVDRTRLITDDHQLEGLAGCAAAATASADALAVCSFLAWLTVVQCTPADHSSATSREGYSKTAGHSRRDLNAFSALSTEPFHPPSFFDVPAP